MGHPPPQSRYPPGPDSRWAAGTYVALHRDPLRFACHLRETHGDFVHVSVGKRHDYFLFDPELIKPVLLAAPDLLRRSMPRPMRTLLGAGQLTVLGDVHKRQRQFVQPYFARERIYGFGDIMVACAEETADAWCAGDVVDVAEEMTYLTFRVIVRTLLGEDCGWDLRDTCRRFAAAKSAADRRVFPVIHRVMEQLPTAPNRRNWAAVRYMDGLIYELIARRRRENVAEAGDVISMLLRQQETPDGRRFLSDRQIRDEVITLLYAGHETISTALTWTWYLLASNPTAEHRLHEELDAVWGDAPARAADVECLVYTRRVFAEAMRLYPPIWLVVRRPNQAWSLGGFDIPAHAFLHCCQYVVQRDPRWFPNPERFDPDRWQPEVADARPRFSYFPFGGGPRQCLGDGFAWVEGPLLLATLAHRWRPRLMPDQRVELQPRLTLQPKFGMRMRLEARAARPQLAPAD